MAQNPGPNQQLHPLAVLIDELKSEDVMLRLNAIRRLSTIALALGPERSRDELVAFLNDSLDDEDEVLLVLAEELGGFSEFVGGKQHAHVILGPLESLASVEETLVRDKAAQSIIRISADLAPQQILDYYLPLLRRLSSAEWFTSRTSATALYAAAYTQLAPQDSHEPAIAHIRSEMTRMFSALCSDETPMVRRAAAKELGGFARVLPKQVMIHDIVPVFRKLSADDQDSVRLLTVEALIAIAEKLSDDECKNYLGASMKSMVADKSWRVRYMVADNFVKLAAAAGDEIIREELVMAFVHLLKDNEAEVRTAAAGQIPGFAKLVDREVILARIMPCVRDIATDSSQHVRAALGTQISGLAPLLGKEATIEHLLPLFLQLLKDEFPDVRLNIISKLEMVNEVIGIDLLSQALLPAIMELAADKQWRVRQAIIEYIPLLAKQLGVQFFDDQLGTLCMNWLGDPVFSIREAATVNLKKLTEVFGVQWASATILPKVLAMGTSTNYLLRMTTLFAITTMAPALNVQTISSSVIQVVHQLANDPIPNIRFNVAKSYEVLATVLCAPQPSVTDSNGKDVTRDEVLPGLTKLKSDEDPDVRYFAVKAIEVTNNLLGNTSAHPQSEDAEMSTL